MGPDMPPKSFADVNKWAQRIFGKICKLHRMGPVLFREVISIILDGAPTCRQNPLLMLSSGPGVSWEVLQITLDGPSAFPRSFVNNIG